MAQRNFAEEANECRRLISDVEARAEKVLLHRIASEFDQLAGLRASADPSYYAARAAEEVSAAVRARHPNARLAHLTMARRYDALAQEVRPPCDRGKSPAIAN